MKKSLPSTRIVIPVATLFLGMAIGAGLSRALSSTSDPKTLAVASPARQIPQPQSPSVPLAPPRATTPLSVTEEPDIPSYPRETSPSTVPVNALASEISQLQNSGDAPQVEEKALRLLHQLAAQNGPLAVQTLLKEKNEATRKMMFGEIMATWADVDPQTALEWLHDPAQSKLIEDGYEVPPRFYGTAFRSFALDDPAAAASSLPAVTAPANRLAAVEAMITTAKRNNTVGEMMDYLGSLGEVQPAEKAIISKLVGDESGYEYWLERLPRHTASLVAASAGPTKEEPLAQP